MSQTKLRKFKWGALFLLIALFFVSLTGCVDTPVNQYTVTYQVAGEADVVETYNYGDAITIRADLVKEGYTFAWEPVSLPATMPAENLVVNGAFTPITYNITYVLNGGTHTGNPETYTIETPTITLAPASKDGHTFDGWFIGETKVTEITLGSTGDKELTAKFTLITHDVTVTGDGVTTDPAVLTGLEVGTDVVFTFAKEGHLLHKVTVDGVDVVVVGNTYTLEVTDNHAVVVEWLPTIETVRALSEGTETEFVGVVTGFTDYSEQHSNFDKVFIEDSTAAIVVYRAGFPQDLKVGDRYKVTGKLDSFNGLIQIASGATVEKLESDIELIAPIEVIDLTEIDETYQAKRIDLEGTVVSVSSSGQELVVKVGENQITVRSNSNSSGHAINTHLLTAIIGQVVKLHGIHVDWYNGSQLLPTLVEQIEFVMPSDEELAQLVLDAIVNEWENKSFNMGTDATLPEIGDYDSTIAWTIPEGAIVEGKWNDVTADTTYAVTVVVTIGDEEVSKVFDITVKFVDGEIIEPTTVEAVFTDHGTNVPSGDITSMFGLDEEIFAIHQVNNDANDNMWMTANEIRLYSVRATGEGTELVFEIAAGYKILAIEFTVLANYRPNAQIFVDGVSNQVYSGYDAVILVEDLSADTVSIKNVHEGGSKNIQLRISGIKITYVGETGQSVDPPVQHIVTFDSDGGSDVPAQTINEGSKATRPTDPTKEGFDFKGWFIGENEFDFDTLITEAITLTAHWEEAEPVELIGDASVEFSFNNLTSKGTGVSGTYLTDKYTDTLLSDIIISGSVYDGNGQGSTNYANTTGLIKFGSSSATGELKFVFNENVLIKTIIIYAAGWNASEGQLRVNGNNPAGESNLADIETRYVIVLDEATNEITIGTSSKRAFLFAVGFYGPEAEVPAAPVITVWEVSFDLGYDGSPVIEPVIVEDGKAVNEPSKPSREGYTFKGWLLNGVEYNFTDPVLSDITLLAKWEKEDEGGGSEPEVIKATMEFGDAKYTDSKSSQNGEKTIDGLTVSVSSSTAFWDGNSTNSLRLGSGSKVGTITLTFEGDVKITKVTIYASQYDGAVSIKVNELTAQVVTNATGSDYIGYEFDVDNLNEFTVSSVKTTKSRVQIQKIVIEYSPN